MGNPAADDKGQRSAARAKQPENKPARHPGGRPTSYKPEYCEKIIEFFDQIPYSRQVIGKIYLKNGDVKEIEEEVPCDLPLFGYFAVKVCDVTSETLREWSNHYPEFSAAYKKAKELQQRILIVNAMRGNYEQPFAIFTSKNIMDWRDRHEILEIKFVYEFVGKVTAVMNKMLPEKCPHCRKQLSLRDETIRQLEDICKSMDEVKAI